MNTSFSAQSHVACMSVKCRPVQPRNSYRNRQTRSIICSADLAGKSVLVIGGTGRVGSSTAAALLQSFPKLKVAIGSRSVQSYQDALKRRQILANAPFVQCDINDPTSIRTAIQDYDLVVHAAGPFQRLNNCAVLEAAIETKTPYMDVCDDTEYSERAKGYHQAAVAAGVPAITTAGIYPGTSNVMAAHIISIGRKEYDDEWRYMSPGPDALQPQRLLYSYYTAGTGGAGPTILETSFLLAGEDVTVYRDNAKFKLPPVSNRRVVDFGPGIGRKGVFLYNLPEVRSGHECMKIPSISARFGTDPFIWNWAMWLTARLMPRHLLENRQFVKSFAGLSSPIVRAVDAIVGEAVAMLVEVEFEGGKSAAGLFVHSKLPEAMGLSVAGFASAMLAGGTQPGVWFPEDKEALKDRRAFLQFAAQGTSRFELNRPVWALEGNPVQLGMGFYW